MRTTACADYFAASPMGRREFLRVGGLGGLCSLGLPQLLQGREGARVVSAPRGRAKACIMLFMWGGPAQQDTWDMKPDAPVEFRGEFRPIATNLPGVHICEHLPRLSQHLDKLTVIRSMTHTDVNHLTATHFLLTGRPVPSPGRPEPEDWPSYGSVMSYLGRGRGPLPPFVSMMPRSPDGAPRFVEESHGRGAGLLGPRHAPFRIDADASLAGYQVPDLTLHMDVPPARLEQRRALLNQMDRQLHGLENQLSVDAVGSHYGRAFSLLQSRNVARAFDLTRENDRVRDRYGRNIHGQAVLQARRLVEAGVPLVTVFWQNDGTTNVSVYWDTHNRNFIDLRTRLCPPADLAFSALLEDLEGRGMLDDVLVVWTGEFGRTPRVGQGVPGGAGAGRDGRDHWPGVFTSVLAGGGIRGGYVHGSSDGHAAYPATCPTRPIDLAATVYHCLGVDPALEFHDRLGRPLVVCDGTPIREILQ